MQSHLPRGPKKSVLVLGGLGQQGQSICQALKDEYHVVCVDRDTTTPEAKKLKHSGVELRRANLAHSSEVRDAFARIPELHCVVLITNTWDESQTGKEYQIAKSVAELTKV